jgi:hypothetical protein
MQWLFGNVAVGLGWTRTAPTVRDGGVDGLHTRSLKPTSKLIACVIRTTFSPRCSVRDIQRAIANRLAPVIEQWRSEEDGHARVSRWQQATLL